jgi:hypothetical protein
MDSDGYSEGSFSSSNNEIDKFLHDSLDNIMDMYDDFKCRFAYNPYFLGHLRGTDLTDFFIDVLFAQEDTENILTKKDYTLFYTFHEEYQNELNTSFAIVDNFLSKYKYSLSPSSWAVFCLQFSIINSKSL